MGGLERAKGFARRLLPPRPAILMYHRVAVESFDPWGLAVSPANFAGQLDWIARNRRPLPLAQFAALHRERRLPRDAVALTFDDGYACNAEVAMPLLERFAVPATIFLPPELIARGREYWWDELARIVLGHGGAALSLDGQQFPLGDKNRGDGEQTPGEAPRTPRQHAYRTLWTLLQRMPPLHLDAAMAALRVQAGGASEPRQTHRPMSAAEVRASSPMFAFGSHALSHASLPALSSAEKASEIGRSLERCADLTGVRPTAFAYPYGDCDAECERLVEAAGFGFACTTESAFVSRRSRRFALPRLWVGDWDARGLARLLGAA